MLSRDIFNIQEYLMCPLCIGCCIYALAVHTEETLFYDVNTCVSIYHILYPYIRISTHCTFLNFWYCVVSALFY